MIIGLLSHNLGRLRIIGFLEGLSYLALIGIAMPIKYLAKVPDAVKIPGMIHGVLFVLYIIWLIIVAAELRWSFKKIILAFIASLLPFGTFWADKKIFTNENES